MSRSEAPYNSELIS